MKNFLTKLQSSDLHLFFVPVLLAAIAIEFMIINTFVKSGISNSFILQAPFPVSHKIILPFLRQSVLGASTVPVDGLLAEAAIVMDSDSKTVLFEKNKNLRFSLASTTKIMTALVGLEYFKPTDVLTVKQEDIEGTVVGFKKGEKFTFEDIVYAMLLPSGNDAAYTIADNYPGGLEKFVEKMNEKAYNLFLHNTHFADPAGLNDTLDYTTPSDLAQLASYALKNPLFSETVSLKHRVISTIEGSKTYSLFNLNKLLDLAGITGVKTGYTGEAKGVLVTSKIENGPASPPTSQDGPASPGQGGHTIIFVVMHSSDRFADTKLLLDTISGNIIYKPFYPFP